MKAISYILSILCLLLTTATAQAQDQNPSEGLFYTGDKYYVVIGVISMIMVGFFVFVLLLDRRIKKIEQQID